MDSKEKNLAIGYEVMIYISSACLKNKYIGDTIKILAQNGIKNIELSGGSSYYMELEKDLLELKAKYGLTYACHAYFPPPRIPFVVNLASCNDTVYQQSIDHYMRCIKMLKQIECSVLSIHAGFLVEIGVDEIGHKLSNRVVYDEESAYERFFAAYESIEKMCAENNIRLYLENNVLSRENYRRFGFQNHMMMTDYASIVRMRECLKFNLLLDLGHLHVSAKTLGLDYVEECNKLKEYVRWIHISENNGIFDGHKPLIRNSVIVNEFKKMYDPEVDVTLETSGDISEIRHSIEIIKEQV